MRKIPTLLQRDPDDMRRVLDEITPGCEWVMAGEGVATRKYDGTCVSFDGDDWWARREVKPGKTPPEGWHQIGEADPATGKRVGWEPIDQSGFAQWHAEVIAAHPARKWNPGTYELLGPKVNGNPEGHVFHVLQRHAAAELWPLLDHPESIAVVRYAVRALPSDWEGIVWHHPDGRMCKIKRRDFPQ